MEDENTGANPNSSPESGAAASGSSANQPNPSQPGFNQPGQDWRFRHRGPGRLGGAIFGLWIVLIGVLFLLQNLGIFYIGQIWQFWPLILIGMGLSHVIGSYSPGGKIWGGFLAGLGVIFLLSNMRMLPPHIWNYIWPLGLVFWGVRMLLGGPRFDRWEGRGRRFRSRESRSREFQWDRFNRDRDPWAATGAGSDTHAGGFHATTSNVANRINEYAILGGVKRRIDSQEFEGGDCTAVMGGIELDLSRAATKLDEVVIEANALMGGVDLRVPPDWEVVVQGMGIMGGYDDATRPPVNMGIGAKRPRLIVTGQALWGGVKVKN
jgi:predicted membrane protein